MCLLVPWSCSSKADSAREKARARSAPSLRPSHVGLVTDKLHKITTTTLFLHLLYPQAPITGPNFKLIHTQDIYVSQNTIPGPYSFWVLLGMGSCMLSLAGIPRRSPLYRQKSQKQELQLVSKQRRKSHGHGAKAALGSSCGFVTAGCHLLRCQHCTHALLLLQVPVLALDPVTT